MPKTPSPLDFPSSRRSEYRHTVEYQAVQTAEANAWPNFWKGAGRFAVGVIGGVFSAVAIPAAMGVVIEKISPKLLDAHPHPFTALIIFMGVGALLSAFITGNLRKWFYSGLCAGCGVTMTGMGMLMFLMAGFHDC